MLQKIIPLILGIIGKSVVVYCADLEDTLASAAMHLEETRPTTDLIRKYGYPAEAHDVLTEDGYILRIDRLPRPQSPAVLVGNALFCNSACYAGLQNDSLAFKLYNEGYDVWLGNFRGSGLSKNHTKYTILDRQFWNYSLHEHGVTDLPAMVDYVLNATDHTSLLYAGHSMAATAWLIAAALRPEYEQRVRAVFLMGPVASLAHHESVALSLLHAAENSTRDFEAALGPHMLPGTNYLSRFLAGILCRSFVPPEEPSHCLILSIIGQTSAGSGNVVYPADFQYYVPSGASVFEALHYTQLANPDWPGFRQFNYGATKNRQVYGQSTPPDYDFSKTNIPAYVYHGRTDPFVTPKDLDFLTTKLKTVKSVYQVPEETFGHLDFVLNPKAAGMYDVIISDMAAYRQDQP